MVLRITILFFFLFNFSNAQIPLDSISIDYFERDNLLKVNKLKRDFNENSSSYLLYDIGKVYENINQEDSAAKYYAASFDNFKKIEDKKGMLKALTELIAVITAQNLYDFDAESYKKEYKKLIENMPKYNRHYTILKKIEARDSIKNDNLAAAFSILYDLKNNFQRQDSLNLYSTILNYIGVCHKRQEIYPDSVKYYYQKSLEIDKISKAPNALFYNYLNQGNFYFEQGNYKKSLKYYDSSALFAPEKFKMKNYRLLYLCYADTYNALGDNAKSFSYLKAHNKLDSLINEKQQNSAIYEIETKYNLKETQKQLNILQKFSENYKKHRIYYISGLLITFLLSLYSFIRWKQVDKKRKKIEQERNRIKQEKEQTLREKELAEREKAHLFKEKEQIEKENLKSQKEVSELKQLVVKEHITLNSAKINLSDLIYIKSERHYLQFYTTDKTELIRGKLYEILEQLPPNFIQTHRSYIVNVNYAKYRTSKAIYLKDKTEIPVSRTFNETVKQFIGKKKKS